MNLHTHCDYFDTIVQQKIINCYGDTEIMSMDYLSKTEKPRNKAMLMIHGYNDYHYNQELYTRLEKEGFFVIGLTLRNYGKNIISASTQFFPPTGKLNIYFQEIEWAISFIDQRLGKSVPIYVTAHSTGGLTFSLYLLDCLIKNKVNRFTKVVLNSPIFDLNDSDMAELGQEYFSKTMFSCIEHLGFLRYTKLNIPLYPKAIKDDETGKIIEYKMQKGKHYDIIEKNGFKLNPPDRCNIPWMMYDSPKYVAISSALTTAYKELSKKYVENNEKPFITVSTLVLYATDDTLLTPSEIVDGANKTFVNLTLYGQPGYHNVFSSSKEQVELFYNAYFAFLADKPVETREREFAFMEKEPSFSLKSAFPMCSSCL